MAKGIKTEHIILGAIVLLVVGYFATGGFQFAAAPIVSGGGPGYATRILVSAYLPIPGQDANVNAELWKSDNSQVIPETSIPAALTQLTATGANTFNGYIMIGNDNLESTTDRGAEIYYHKESVSWTNQAGDLPFDNIPVYNESTPSWTTYDDGTVESNISVTVGSGATVTTTELRIEPSSDAVLGNPEFSRPLAICFNESTAGTFEEVRPAQYDEVIAVPGFLSGKNVIKSQCYVLPTSALYEGVSGQPQFYRFYIRIEAKSGQDPDDNMDIGAILLDKTYYKGDNRIWTSGFGDESSTGTDTDVGMDALANHKPIFLA